MRDISGRRFGMWTAVEFTDRDRWGTALWLCECECGTRRPVRMGHLVSGQSTGCGCANRGGDHTTHGHTARGQTSRLYRVWSSMVQRCSNPNDVGWQWYGGAGVQVCERWLTFANFLEDMGERPPDPEGWSSRVAYWSLDRIDPYGDYEPSNCRWASPTEQARNQRRFADA